MALAFIPPMTLAGTGAPPDGPTDAVLRALPVLAGAFLLHLGIMTAQPFVMELIPGFGRPELTGTYFGIFYAVSGIAAAVGNTAVGWAMDAAGSGGAGSAAGLLPWVCCLLLGLVSAGGVAWLHRTGTLPAAHPAPVPVTA